MTGAAHQAVSPFSLPVVPFSSFSWVLDLPTSSSLPQSPSLAQSDPNFRWPDAMTSGEFCPSLHGCPDIPFELSTKWVPNEFTISTQKRALQADFRRTGSNLYRKQTIPNCQKFSLKYTRIRGSR